MLEIDKFWQPSKKTHLERRITIAHIQIGQRDVLCLEQCIESVWQFASRLPPYNMRATPQMFGEMAMNSECGRAVDTLERSRVVTVRRITPRTNLCRLGHFSSTTVDRDACNSRSTVTCRTIIPYPPDDLPTVVCRVQACSGTCLWRTLMCRARSGRERRVALHTTHGNVYRRDASK